MSAWFYLSITSTALLGAAGVLLANFRLQSMQVRVICCVGLIGMIALGVTGTIISQESQSSYLEEALTGGDNYAYLWAEVDAPRNETDGVPIWFQVSGLMFGLSYWIAPDGVTDPEDERYWSIGGGFIGERSAGFRTKHALPPGKYRIDIDARNGHFVETLEIKEIGGRLVQLVDVYRDGQAKVYSSH